MARHYVDSCLARLSPSHLAFILGFKKEEYVKTLIINGQKIEVGLDDYGQCYFFEYKDKNGKVQEIYCGSYNPNYEEEIADYFGVRVEEIEEVS